MATNQRKSHYAVIQLRPRKKKLRVRVKGKGGGTARRVRK